MLTKQNEYVPIIFVDHSTDCSYALKASNVNKKGGAIMLLASDSNILENDYNIDDGIHFSSIPTVIIPKDFADIMRAYFNEKNHEDEPIVLSIKFSGYKNSDKVTIEMYFRSDDFKAINFFTTFKSYKETLGDKFHFIPYYKYTKLVNEEIDNTINENSKIPCIKENHYCATKNYDSGLLNARLILLENIRQSCIYKETSLDKYWEYMIEFNRNCFNGEKKFTEECSEKVFDSLKIPQITYKDEIRTCMMNMVTRYGKVESDYNHYALKKIYSVPEIHINEVPYRGSWYSKLIMRAICDGFLDDQTKCSEFNEIKVTNVDSNFNYGKKIMIFLIAVICAVVAFSLLCYKKYINSMLENSINEKIQDRVMSTISQYKSFTDSKDSKLELI